MGAAKRLVPLLNRIVVEKMTAPNKTVGGIMLPETAVPKVRRIVQTCAHRLEHLA
jgi:chaperonin GroES